MQTLSISSSKTRYPVHIGDGAMARLTQFLEGRREGPIFLITSPNIWARWQQQVRQAVDGEAGAVRSHQVLMVPRGEQHKTLGTVERLAEELARKGATRDALLIGFGGGVIGDITGFLAATYLRGVDYVHIPSTLLAQVDSSVGGKTGVNLKAGKNLMGSFNPPLAVFADTQLLQTLPKRELRAGLYESIKTAIIGDAQLFGALETSRAAIFARDAHTLQRIVSASVRVKRKIVMEDEHEHGPRMTLNLGHTLGHAIEAATQYRELLHGEAVAWGMRFATEISRARGELSEADAARIDKLILNYGALRKFSVSSRRVVQLTHGDKKNVTGQRRFILPVAIGRTVIATNVTDEEMIGAMKRMGAR